MTTSLLRHMHSFHTFDLVITIYIFSFGVWGRQDGM